jgi:hypothetical protein
MGAHRAFDAGEIPETQGRGLVLQVLVAEYAREPTPTSRTEPAARSKN